MLACMPANVFDDDWDIEQSQPGFTWKRLQVGARLRAEGLGMSVFELPPGQRSFPYHLHHANEELLVVLEGSVNVRSEAGEETLGRGDAVVFPVGKEGAHQVINRSEEVARFMVVSTMNEPDIVEYPDTGKVGLRAGAPPGGRAPRTLHAFLRRDAEVGYFDDEPTD
jgi:uncharacterized cupin superfamily protein